MTESDQTASIPGSPPLLSREGLTRAGLFTVLTALLCLINQFLSVDLPQPWPLWPAVAFGYACGLRYGLPWLLPSALGALPFLGFGSAVALDSVALALGVVLGPVLSLLVLRRLDRWRPVQGAHRPLTRFMIVAGTVTVPVTTACSVVIGRLTTAGQPYSRLLDFPLGLPALGMWLSGLVTLLILTPAILALSDWSAHQDEANAEPGGTGFDPACAGLALILALVLVIVTSLESHLLSHILLLLVAPILVRSALRNGQRTHALTSLVVTLPVFAASLQSVYHQSSSQIEFLWLGSELCAVLVVLIAMALLIQSLALDFRGAMHQIGRLGREDLQTGLLNDRGLALAMQSALTETDRQALGVIGVSVSNLEAVQELCGPLETARIESALAGLLQTKATQHPAGRQGRVTARWSNQRLMLMVSAESLNDLRVIVRDLYTALGRVAGQTPSESINLQVVLGAIHIGRDTLAQPEECLAALEDAIAIAASVRDPQIFVEPLSASTLDSRREERDRTELLRESIRHGRLEIHAQPVIDPDAPEGSQSYEVLTRLRDRSGALIHPPEFMPLATRAQLLARLDRAVIHRVFEWLATHPNALSQTHKCAINLSGASLDDPGLPGFIDETRRFFDIPAPKIVFEISESSAIRQLSAASRLVDDLKTQGFGIALDDFGTGLATFEYLKRFALDYVKIDGYFIRNLLDDELDEEIVLSTLRVAQKMKLRTVAEHVQSEPVHQRLRALGIHHLQGDLFGRAAPIEALFDPNWPISLRDRQPDTSGS